MVNTFDVTLVIQVGTNLLSLAYNKLVSHLEAFVILKATVVRSMKLSKFFETSVNDIGLVNLIILSDGVTQLCREEIMRLSEQETSAVIASGRVELKDRITYSCVVAENGELVGTADNVHSLVGFDCANTYKIFELSCGKVGLLIGDDCYYPEAAKCLVDSGSSLIVCMRDKSSKSSIIMARSHAISNGVRLIYASRDFGMACDYNGNITNFDGTVVNVEFTPIKVGALENARAKGVRAEIVGHVE